MNFNPESVVIFTDGSSRGNPGPGGWGAVVVFPQGGGRPEVPGETFSVRELGGREGMTTNNRMELSAAIGALRFFAAESAGRHFADIVLYSDSSYVVNGMTRWVSLWRKKGWLTAEKKTVENRDLWEELARVSAGLPVRWENVGGHAGVPGNERCDRIATAFADGKEIGLYSGSLFRYPIKNILEAGRLGSKNKEAGGGIRQGKRSPAYSYVSEIGGEIAVHPSWAECEKRVKGVSGARYKKASDKEDERRLVGEFKKKTR